MTATPTPAPDLGPLPEPAHGFYAAPMFTEAQMRAYAAQGYAAGVAAERGRWRSEILGSMPMSRSNDYTTGAGEALDALLEDAPPQAAQPAPGVVQWVPAHERVPARGTECVVLLHLYGLPFVSVDTWDVQREDPTGMGGPTIETGEGWNENFERDVIAWIEIPPHPPAVKECRWPA